MFYPLKSKKDSLFMNPDDSQKQKPSVCIWNQWLAGIIDGDGCFYINKAGQISLEITVAIEDERLLQEIKQRVGGRLKPRAGSQSVRLRVFKREALCGIVNRINGHIRLKSRYDQFKQVCQKLNMQCLEPTPLVIPNGYISGLFDADGSVTLNVSRSTGTTSIKCGPYGKYLRLAQARGHHELSLHIVSKDRYLLKQVQSCLKFGSICSDRVNPSQNKPNELHRWYFRSYDDVQQWLDHIRIAPLRSQKRQRCFLLKAFFSLKAQKAHLAVSTQGLYKRWDRFCRRWFKIDTL